MHLASGMVGQSGYTEHDADDLLQILIITGTLALPRFNQAKAKRSTFIYSVLREKVIDLARHAGRAKRDRTREAFSLDETWPEDETEETAWGEIIGEEHTLNQDGAIRADRADLRPLRADIKEVIEDLPPSLRDAVLENPRDANFRNIRSHMVNGPDQCHGFWISHQRQNHEWKRIVESGAQFWHKLRRIAFGHVVGPAGAGASGDTR